MISDAVTALRQSRATLGQDLLGAAALVVIVLGGLCLPGL